ncbi:TIGR01777 family oxidoreductase [Oceanobacillus sp. CAU 1775]
MNFIITGGTGFIGGHLKEHLIKKGHHVFVLTRSPKAENNTNFETHISYSVNTEELPEIHGVINLAGESLFGYWSEEKKDKILSSRLKVTEQVIQLVKKLRVKPKVFINGSAVGYYGMSEELIFTEKTTTPGEDFLAQVVVDWEKTASEVESLGIRVVYTRFGIVLGKKEGSLPMMALPVKLFVGGKVGDGEQWISWIHINDAISLLDFCLFNEEMNGPVNITAPRPQRNHEFYKTLAEVYKRPYWFHAPAPLLILALGEMATLLTEGQYVLPQKALEQGFKHDFPKLKEALNQLK